MTQLFEFKGEVDDLRCSEDAHYYRNVAALGKPTLELIPQYLDLYLHLWHVATQHMARDPIKEAELFTHQMLLECRADLVRTVLMIMRTHLTEAHGQTRRAIECCAWAKRIYDRPELVGEWLRVDTKTAPSREWRENISSKLLFPLDHPKLFLLRERYQVTSRCVHPFRFSFVGRTDLEELQDGTVSIIYSFFDPDDIWLETPTRFLWTLQTHDLIFDVFEEVFARQLADYNRQKWEDHRKTVREALAAMGRMWIERTKKAESKMT
jgi:hypothetical protein